MDPETARLVEVLDQQLLAAGTTVETIFDTNVPRPFTMQQHAAMAQLRNLILQANLIMRRVQEMERTHAREY